MDSALLHHWSSACSFSSPESRLRCLDFDCCGLPRAVSLRPGLDVRSSSTWRSKYSHSHSSSSAAGGELDCFQERAGRRHGDAAALALCASDLSSAGMQRSARRIVSAQATADSSFEGEEAAQAEKQQEEKTMGMLQLGTYFGFWYFYNIIFNIYNKKALNVFSFPWLLASFQLFTGALWMLGLWRFKLQPCPPVSKEFLSALALPAFFHTVGHISACISFSKVAVSFTHIIKAAEPAFSVVFSTFLGESYPFLVWLSILPIVFGCALAAGTEVTFNLTGFWSAMLSNVGFVLRNIYSKRLFKDFKQYDGINFYGWITILSLAYLFPVAIVIEGSRWVSGYKEAVVAVGQASTFNIWVLLSGIFFHLYNQSSYQALFGISPLTFSVGNTMKRVVVIVATVLVFKNPIRPLNALGSAIAIGGAFLYSQVSQKAKEKSQL